MSEQQSPELVEVFEVEFGKGRPYYTHRPGILEVLPADKPLPMVGDIILLPVNVTGDSPEQAFVIRGSLTPFRVVEREHMYFRGSDEKHDPINTKPARYLNSWIFVRRVTEAEYSADPGKAE